MKLPLRGLGASKMVLPTALLGLAAYYWFLSSAGHLLDWPVWSTFVNVQAEAFRSGHLFVPAPASRWDYSLYHGRYYLYWGLLPAGLLAAWKALFRVREVVNDAVLTYLFALGRLVAGSVLIRELAQRVPERPPRWAVGLAIAVFALAYPTPFLLNRGAVYEVAIFAGSCFALAGLVYGARAMFAETPGGADRWLVLSSLAFGCAGTSRITLLVAASLSVLLTAVLRWRAEGAGLGRFVRIALCAGAPMSALFIVHFVLNQLRFDDWREFGVKHQLSFPFQMGSRYVAVNLWLYLLEPFKRSCAFPFLAAPWQSQAGLLPTWLAWPQGFRTEPTVGLLVAVPYAWLLPVGAAVAIIRRVRWRRGSGPGSADTTPSWSERWVLLVPAVYSLAAAVPILIMFSLSARYQADFASTLLVVATVAGWKLLAAPRSRGGRVAVVALYVTLAAVTLLFGVALGYGGYFDQFGRHNRPLTEALQHALDVCPRR